MSDPSLERSEEFRVFEGFLRGAERRLGNLEGLALTIPLVLRDDPAIAKRGLAGELIPGCDKPCTGCVELRLEVRSVQTPDQRASFDDFAIIDRKVDQTPGNIEGETTISHGGDFTRETAEGCRSGWIELKKMHWRHHLDRLLLFPRTSRKECEQNRNDWDLDYSGEVSSHTTRILDSGLSPNQSQSHMQNSPQPTTLTVAVRSVQLLLDDENCPFIGPRLDPRVADVLRAEASLAKMKKPAFRVIVQIPGGDTSRISEVREAVRNHFEAAVAASELELKALFRDARRSSGIALLIAVLLMALSEILFALDGRPLADALARGLIILSWVALWHPADLLLYAHLPIRENRKLSRALAEATVEIQPTS